MKNVDHSTANAEKINAIAIRNRPVERKLSHSGSLSKSSQVGTSISVSQPTVNLWAVGESSTLLTCSMSDVEFCDSLLIGGDEFDNDEECSSGKCESNSSIALTSANRFY